MPRTTKVRRPLVGSTGGVSRRKTTRRYAARRPRKVAGVRRHRRTGNPTRSLRTRWQDPLLGKASYKLTYADTAFDLITGAGGIPIKYVFAGNGPYDPDRTGAGVQPYGYDNILQAFNYQYYVVVGARIRVNVTLNAECSDYVFTIVPHRQNVLTYDNADDLRVIPHAKQVHLCTQFPKKSVSMYITTKQMYPEFDITGNQFRGAWNGSPASMWYFNLYGDTQSFGATIDTFFDCTITYYLRVVKNDDENES